LVATLAYLASEDPTMIAHINPDSARAAFAKTAAADSTAGAGRRGGGFGGPRAWPQCDKAPRTTKARLR